MYTNLRITSSISYSRASYASLFLLLFFSMLAMHAVGQPRGSSLFFNPIPKSPNAAAYGKYADVAVNNFTGIPDIRVPLLELSDEPIPIPISLSYHASGIKVEQLASDAGLGWTLNGGGIITRQVQGIPDDNRNGLYNRGCVTAVSIATNEQMDTEPDIFTYNFGGYSGKFYFKKGTGSPTIVPLNKTELLFEELHVPRTTNDLSDGKGFQGFIITTPEGNKYYFGKSTSAPLQKHQLNCEFTYVKSDNNPQGDITLKETTTGWLLTKIVSFDGVNVVDYTYTDSNFSFFTKAPSIVRVGFPPVNFGLYYTNFGYVTQTNIRSKQLFRIKGKFNTIIFSYSGTRDDLRPHISNTSFRPSKLNKILLNGAVQHTFVFDYFRTAGQADSPETMRLKLKEVKDHKTLTQNGGYSFRYYNTASLPNRLSMGRDHWGYPNGKENENASKLMAGRPINHVYTGKRYDNYDGITWFSDRRAYPENSQERLAGVLKQIIHPTRGTTRFNYEGNLVKNPKYTSQVYKSYINSQGGCNGDEHNYTVALNKEDLGKLYLHVSTHLCNPDNATITVSEKPIDNVNVPHKILGTASLSKVPHPPSNAPMKYKKLTSLFSDALSQKVDGKSWVYISVKFKNRGNVNLAYRSGYMPVGGLRIKKIFEQPLVGNTLSKLFYYDSTEKENYQGFLGVPSFPHESGQGRLFAIPKYRFRLNDFGQSTNSYARFISNSNIGMRNSYFGGHVGYPFVRIVQYNKDNVKAKATEYKYHIDDQLLKYNANPKNFFPQMPIFDYASGTLKEVDTYSYDTKGGSKLKNLQRRENYCYNSTLHSSCLSLSPDEHITRYQGLYKWYIFRSNNKKYWARKQYDLKAGRVRLYSKRRNDYFYDRSNNVTEVSTETHYTYDDRYSRPISVTQISPNNIYRTEVNAYNRYFGNRIELSSKTKYQHKTKAYSANDITEKYTYDYRSGQQQYLSKISYAGICTANNSSTNNLFTKDLVTYDNYNAQGMPEKMTQYGWKPRIFSYTTKGLLKSETFNNHTKTYDYYPSTSLLRKATKIDGTSTSYTYDSYRRLKTMTDDQRGVVTSYDYRYGNPAQGGNYTKTTTTYPSVAGSKLSTLTDYEYYDGLGRKILTRKVKQGSSTSYDVYQMLHYDNRGRVTKQYEPFQLRTGTGFINPYAIKYASRYHALTTFDDLDRVLTVTPANWHPTTYSYGTNAAGEVDGYAPNTLYKTTTTDAEGDITETYTNTIGKQVLLRRKGADGNYDTYRKYDPKDRPTEVIPPGSTTGNKKLNYIYTYTEDDMIRTKIIPDRGMTLYWYDKRNLPIHMQDTKMAKEGKYFTTHFDEYGRHRYSGFTKAIYALPSINLASFFTSDGYLRADVYGTTGISKGKITKSYVRTLLPDGELGNGKTSTLSYDPYGRLEESRSTILKEDNTTYSVVDSIRYDRADNVLRHRSQVRRGSKTHTTIDRYTIDAVGRQETHYNKLDALPEKCLVQKRYTAKGQLRSLFYGTGNDKSRQLYYRYLTHGPLYRINSAHAADIHVPIDTFISPGTGASGSKIKRKPYLMYHGLEYYKDGNIKRTTTQILAGSRRIYDYTYDKYDRLKTATYSEKNYNNTVYARGQYDASYTYDKRGNILTLQRKGQYPVPGSSNPAYGSIDNLRFGYTTGNAPQTIHESSRPAGVSTMGNGKKFQYDANGNMTYLPHAEASMAYNHLNLPRKTTKTSGSIDWYYLADGTLLSKKVTALGKQVEEKDYISNSEYIKGDLAQVNHAYGRITRDRNCSMTTDLGGYVPSGDHTYYGTAINISGHVADKANVNLRLTTGIAMAYKPTVLGKGGRFVVSREACSSTKWVYEYAVRDHLGNTRAMFSGDGPITAGNIQSEYYYYPFGMEQEGIWQSKPRRDNKYRFGGKEVISDLGLGLYDFTNRTFAPDLGRFLQVDNLAERGPEYSTYNYCFNNPVNFVDPDGRWPLPPGLGVALKHIAKSKWNSYRSTASGLKNAHRIITGESPGFWKSAGMEVTAATLHFGNYTSQNDASILSTGYNMDGTTATGTDKALAGVFIALPISGGALKNLAGEGAGLLGKFVRKFTNQASHLDAKHIDAAVGDILGNPITINGKAYDHLDEVQNALGGLGKQLGKLNDAIDAGSFSGEALDAARNLRSTLQNQKDQITDVLNRAREKAENR